MPPRCLLPIAAALMATGSLSAAVISINFNRNTDEPFAATVSAGAVFVPNWNQMPPQGVPSGTNLPLTDETGATVAATVSYSAGTTWAQGSPNQADGNISLLKGYLDDSNATVTVSAIPFALYDVYVYALGDGAVNSALGVYTLTPAGGSAINFSWLRAANPTAGGTLIAGAANQQGHYFKISGITASSFNLVSDNNGANGRGPIAGIQIVQVPEPSVFSLLLLPAATFLRRRR